MSSQGAGATGTIPTIRTTGYGPTGGSQILGGYKFDPNSIKDSSDWIAAKKNRLILNESKIKRFQDPYFVYGNDYRLQYLDGLRQNGSPTGGCVGCNSSPYVGTVGLPNLT
jgi:hypothetical protein